MVSVLMVIVPVIIVGLVTLVRRLNALISAQVTACVTQRVRLASATRGLRVMIVLLVLVVLIVVIMVCVVVWGVCVMRDTLVLPASPPAP